MTGQHSCFLGKMTVCSDVMHIHWTTVSTPIPTQQQWLNYSDVTWAPHNCVTVHIVDVQSSLGINFKNLQYSGAKEFKINAHDFYIFSDEFSMKRLIPTKWQVGANEKLQHCWYTKLYLVLTHQNINTLSAVRLPNILSVILKEIMWSRKIIHNYWKKCNFSVDTVSPDGPLGHLQAQWSQWSPKTRSHFVGLIPSCSLISVSSFTNMF